MILKHAAPRRSHIQIEPSALVFIDERCETYDDGRRFRGGAVTQTILRYEAILFRARAELRELLSDGEIGLILDSLNGTIVDERTIFWLSIQIADSIELDGLDKKWHIDGPALVGKIEAMTPAQIVALTDAAERFWKRVSAGSPHTEITVAEILK